MYEYLICTVRITIVYYIYMSSEWKSITKPCDQNYHNVCSSINCCDNNIIIMRAY